MVAIDEERGSARYHESLGISTVTTAGIFGPNASGKSNILAAFAWLREAVAGSLRNWDETIPIQPFAFGDARHQDTSFVVDLVVEGIRFEYILELNRERVSFEALYHYPEGRRRRIFERKRNELILQRGLGELAGARSLLTDRSLVLSIVRRFEEPATVSFIRSLMNMTSLGHSLNGFRRHPGFGRFKTMDMFEAPIQDELDIFLDDELDLRDSSMRQQAMSLLQLADLGVADVRIEEEKVERAGGIAKRRSAKLVHSSDDERLPFDYEAESEGTRTWFDLIGPVLVALQRGSLVLFDELEANLHPVLTSQLVQLFQGRASNPRGAQLIFTSHDTNLLNQLNRDEIWLTQKGSDGATRFAALSDFAGEKVRRSQNVERGYLSGRFGALPDVSRPEVLRELGLLG